MEPEVLETVTSGRARKVRSAQRTDGVNDCGCVVWFFLCWRITVGIEWHVSGRALNHLTVFLKRPINVKVI